VAGFGEASALLNIAIARPVTVIIAVPFWHLIEVWCGMVQMIRPSASKTKNWFCGLDEDQNGIAKRGNYPIFFPFMP
jgi:hypothetical protein